MSLKDFNGGSAEAAGNRTVNEERSTEELERALKIAEENWKQASQANFELSQKINRLKVEFENKLNEKDAQITAWRDAYNSVISSRTWRMVGKVKKLFGKGK